jgi:hypothetical protein
MLTLYRWRRKIIRFFFREQWSVLICDKNNQILTRLVPEKDRHWADPFPVFHEGRFYIFLEQQFLDKKGILGFIEVNNDFSYSAFTPVLETNYHLSWPNVFSVKSVWYMIPETHEHKTIDLYRALHFPDKWEFHSTLIENIEAVDTALFYHRNKWWLFTGTAVNHSINSSLSIFWSGAFPSGIWTPLSGNPVVSGLSGSRMAGNIFIDAETGHIIRPAQRCTKEYGERVILNRIKTLDPDAYEEERECTVYPERKLHAACTHTYNSTNQFLVRDIKTRRFRLLD